MSVAEAKNTLSAQVKTLLNQDFVTMDDAAYKSLKELQQDIDNDFFTVVVLGEFKRGKSTFINALLGNDLLPTDILPETATINALIYNDKPEVEVIMQNGRVEHGVAERSFLERYSAKNQDDEVNAVKYIKIGYPFRLLENNIVIVDTPGVSDLNEQRCEVTYNFIPKANAVIFLLDANSPLKKTEMEFVEEKLLAQGIDNIIFVVNKYDGVDEDEEDDFLESLQMRIMRALSESKYELKNFQLYPLSAKMALHGILNNNEAYTAASGINEVKEALHRTIQGGRVEEAKLRRYKKRLQEVLLSINSRIENLRALKAADVDCLREAKNKLQDMLQEQIDNKQKISDFAEAEKKNILAMTDKSIQYFYKKFEDRMIDDIQFYKGLDFKDYVEQRVAKNAQRELENWLAVNAPNIDVLLRTLEREIARGISYRFNQKIALSANFGTGLRGSSYDLTVTADDVSKASLKAGMMAAGGAGVLMLIGSPMLMPFISMAAYPFIQKQMLQEQLAQAKATVIPAFQEQLAECVLQMKQEIHRHIDEKCMQIVKNSECAYDEILQSLEQRISQEIRGKENAGSEASAEIQKLTTQLESVQKYLHELQEV